MKCAADQGWGERGMSMVEVAVAFLLIGSVVAFALPAMDRSVRAYNVRSTANLMAQQLTAARALAMLKNKDVTVSFQRESGVYGYDFVPDEPDGIPDTEDPDNPGISYPISSIPSGIAMDFPGSTTKITFNSRGELPIGAEEQSIRLKNSALSAAVNVNLRGKVWVSTN